MYSKTLLNFRTSRLLKRNDLQRDSIGFSQSKLIGILFTMEGEEKFKLVKMLQKDLEELGKKVEVLSHLPKGATNYEFLYKIFNKQDVSFTGKFKNDDVLRFAGAKFDYLLVLDSTLSPLIQNIIAMSQAHCRMGSHSDESEKFFEFMVAQKEKQNSIQLIQEISKYLKGLTKESSYV